MKIRVGNTEIEAEPCRGFFGRLRGLMFSPRRNIVLCLPREGRNRAAIHSFFVFFPFSAVFLNSRREVVDVKTMKPFRTYRPRRPAQYVLEIGRGYEELAAATRES